MAVGRPSIELPNELETMLLQVVANHAAMALQQAILLLRRQGEAELESVRAAQQAAAARLGIRAFALPMDRLLHEATEVVHDTLRADCSDLLVLARSGRSLLLQAGVGWAQRLVARTRVSARLASQAAFTLRSAEPLVVTNLGSEARFTVAPLYRKRGVVSSISAVVHDHRQPFGILSVHSLSPRSFTTDDVHFVQSVASLVAAAVQRLKAEAERDEMLVRLQRSLATRERLISVVAHDLGNPLSAILIGSNVLLQEEPPPHGGTERAAALIGRSARWMQRIVSDLLDRESLEAGRLALYPERVAPSRILDELQELFTAAASERSVRFVVESEPDLPPIRADTVRLVQVLSNLVGNAIKFTPAGGRIVLSARASVDTARARGYRLAVRFAVSDTGPGIPREDLAHIFDWFWHGRPTRRGATGLGLAIARSLVAAHKSRLNVESAGGHGTTFWFSLPAAPAEAAAPG
jgi:signal transduction histidine kinase